MPETRLQPITATNKADQVTHVLAELARSLGAGAKLPTTRDLRKKMQISLHTLEAALRRLELQGLLHRKQGSGIYVSALARTRRIGILILRELLEDSQQNNSVYSLLLQSLRKGAAARDEALVCYTYASDHDQEKLGPQQFELDIRNGRADAMITVGLSRKQMNEVSALGAPCVFLTDDGTCAPRIALKLDSMIAQGVAALVQRGCRRIGFAYPTGPDGSAYADYITVFQQALRQQGLPESFCWRMPFDVNFSRFRSLDASRLFYRMWTGQSERPDGLLSTDDQYTSGILHAMDLLQLCSSKDLQVASHANKGLELFGQSAVMRFDFDPDEIAGMLLRASDDLLSGRQTQPEQIVEPRMQRLKAPEQELVSAK